MQVCVHPCGWLIGDLDGVLQDPLWNGVSFRGGGGLSAHKHSEVLVAAVRVLLQTFLQSAKPARHQVDVLQGKRKIIGWGEKITPYWW